MSPASKKKDPDLWELSDPEQAVVAAAEKGELCELGDSDPGEGAEWGEDRSVRAEVVYALCCGTGPEWPVHTKGVRIKGARIRGLLDFEDATLRVPLYLVRSYSEHPLTLTSARAKTLVFSGSCVPGISAAGLRAAGEVLLDSGFSAKGEVRFQRATIGNALDCDGGSFESPEDSALLADGLDCKGNVFLGNGFSAKGAVRLVGATVGGNLECRGGSFENPEGDALSAESLDCKRDVFLGDGFSAKGRVQLLGATIRGDLDCNGGSFENSGDSALLADGLDCKGRVFLGNGFSAKGAVRLVGATIGGSLECDGGSFENPEGTALNLTSASAARVDLRGQTYPPVGIVDLTDADAGAYLDGAESWPQPDQLRVEGFRYSSIVSRDLALRRTWLQLAPFSNQPYAQFASVLKARGNSDAAKRVLIDQQKERLRRGREPWRTRLGLRFLGLTVGFGYRPGRAVWALLGFFLLGWILFATAGELHLMAPTSTSVMASDSWRESREIGPAHADYPPFQAAVYSADTLVPVVRLGMESSWQPSLAVGGPFAGFVWWYLRVHIALGWVLSTLAVLGFTGVVRPQ